MSEDKIPTAEIQKEGEADQDEEMDYVGGSFRSDWFPIYLLTAIFLISQFLALIITPQFIDQEAGAFEEGEEDNVFNILLIVVEIIVITGVLLWLKKHGKDDIIHYLILGVFAFAVANTLTPLLSYVIPSGIACGLGLVIGLGVTTIYYKFPEWYVIDFFGVMVCAGITTMLGISMVPGLVILFLIILACYDAIAVYKTKHMVDLADVAVEKKLPLMFVVPKSLPYSFLEAEGLKEQLDSGKERDAMFMGLGDVVMPTLLAVSAVTFLDEGSVGSASLFGLAGPFVVAFAVIIGTMLGFFTLMWFVLKGRPQAGLPLLNSGAIGGYVISTLLLYGELGLGLS